MAYNLKITVYNNRDYEQRFQLQDVDEDELDISNSKLIFSITLDSKTITHATGVTGNQCIFIEDEDEGEIKLVLPYQILKTIPEGKYLHDLIYVDLITGKRSGIWTGTITVKKGATP